MSAQGDKKTCTKCGRYLPTEDFYLRSDTGRLTDECRSCKSVRSKRWQQNNREFVRLLKKRWQSENRPLYLAQKKRDYKNNLRYYQVYAKNYWRESVESISDFYAISLLGLKAEHKNVAKPLIELKLLNLKIKRILKEKNNGNQNA